MTRSRWTTWRWTMAVLLVGAVVAAACSGSDDDDDGPSPDEDAAAVAGSGGGGPGPARLSTGEAAPPEVRPVSVVAGEPLGADRVGTVLDALPPWTGGEADVQEFSRPAESLPPPLVGETVDEPFPPDAALPPPEIPEGPLEVLRFSPAGDVDVAPWVDITFNQPMVPLTTLGQLDVTDVPARVNPETPGRWQWIGTRTLRFEHDADTIDRLPMATSYGVEIPAGTTSETGGELAETVTWTFTTPPVADVRVAPLGYSLPVDQVFVATFDQRIDPEAVLDVTTLRVAGDDLVVRLATDDEIDSDPDVQARVDAAPEGRWMAFRADEPMARDAAVRIVIGPDTPSAEGPNTSPGEAKFDARTYAPLAVHDEGCANTDWGGVGRCGPGASLVTNFNNPIDPDVFDPSMVTVSPEPPGLFVALRPDRAVEVRGATAAETTYEVTFDAALADTFGQTLGDDVTVTFDVGVARPALERFNQPLVTLDPFAATPTLPVRAVNHDVLRVRAFTVDPATDWVAFVQWAQGFDNPNDLPSRPDWPVALDEEVPTGTDPHQYGEVPIDLSAALGDGPGHVVVLVEPTGALAELTRDDEDWWQNRPILVWAQATDLVVDGHISDGEVLVWATDLTTGEPAADAAVALAEAEATTDANGLATLAASAGDDDGNRVVRATWGEHAALLPVPWLLSMPSEDRARWYVFDDRGTYRPGETVQAKGWVRRLRAEDRQIDGYGPATLDWELFDAAGAELADGTAEVSDGGGFDLAAPIPAGANLGAARLRLTLDHEGGTEVTEHTVAIQEFRRPNFEVTTAVESSDPHYADEAAQVSVSANYYAGGGLPDAPVEWTVRTRTADYAPPGWDEFSFGRWQPWWPSPIFGGGAFYGDDGPRGSFDSFPGGPSPDDDEEIDTFSATTDADGRHVLRIEHGDSDALPASVATEATVVDVDRQAWTDGSDLLVHPGAVTVGLRNARAFVDAGDDLVIDAVAVDLDGEVVADRPITVEVSRTEPQYVDGQWEDVAVDTENCELTSGDEPVECRVTATAGGRWAIDAVVTDAEGRNSRSELTAWVRGGERAVARTVDQETAEVIPDAEQYEPGDTAELLVVSPFETASGLVTISRGGIIDTATFTVADHSAVVEIPVVSEHVPNLSVQVDLAGITERVGDDGEPVSDAAPRPAYATGFVDLEVSVAERRLDVELEPADRELEPGGSTTVALTVSDHTGAPAAGAEVAVVVVDEAVLALSDYELGDPLESFYETLFPEVQSRHGRAFVRLVDPTAVSPVDGPGVPGDGEQADMDDSAGLATTGAYAAEGAMRSGGDQASEVAVRVDFDALALFEPEVITGDDGTATVEVDLPDSLTRYRVMAVASHGDERAGSAESTLVARLPLMVRPSPPRFLSFGDTFELPVVVQNDTDDELEVDVVVEGGNLTLTDADETDGAVGRRVTVPARDRVEVRFAAETAAAGVAGYRAVAVGGGAADAAAGSLPVHTPATTEAFATYGVLDEGGVLQPMEAPTGVFPQFGGLEVGTSSTAMHALTDALIYLRDYDFASADASAGRILAIAALRDVLEAFDAQGLPPAEELTASVDADIADLVALQLPDGGFLGWRGAQMAWPFTSIQAAHALVLADQRGYVVPSEPRQRALRYLADIEAHIPSTYGEQTRRTLRAYALSVRDLAGNRDPAKAAALWQEAGDGLGLDAMAWILPVLDDAAARAEILRTFTNRATETAGAATFTTDYGDDAYLLMYSDRRTDGIVLDALVRVAPDDDLVPKVVAGLLGNQTRGRWQNVQENTFILLALHRYFTTFESVTPDFVARIWLGEQYAGEHEYRGRTTDRGRTTVPMADLVASGDEPLVVAKEGEGRLYYRLGMRYAPDDLELEPLDRGFVVQRAYEAVDDPDDVTRDDDGTWQVKAGATVRVRLTMVADSRRTHVVLLDPYAAGTEPLNPELAVTATPLPPDDTPGVGGIGVGRPGEFGDFEGDAIFLDIGIPWWPWARWYERDDLRDDRAEAYTSLLDAGVHEYTYLARATTPGRFVVPPARAEEIYAPETFGRSASEVMVIADR